MTISLLISTYNSPKALNLCLESITRQTRKPDEVLIADDGSTAETREVIERYVSLLSMPVKHIWHEDKGFRLAEIRNKAITASSCDYIIQIDGDIVMDSRYIEDLENNAIEGYFCTGSRAMVSEELTAAAYDKATFNPSPMMKGIKARENAFRLPWLSAIYHNHRKVNGCHMSYWRKDAVAINGYDNNMVGWGAEDHDFADRLRRYGIKQRHLKFCAIQYHLFHKTSSNSSLQHNKQLLEENAKNNVIRCTDGITKD